MYKVVRTFKPVKIVHNSIWEEMIKFTVLKLCIVNKEKARTFKFKKDIYSYIEDELIANKICNKDIHIGKNLTTGKSLLEKAIKEGYLRLLEVY